MNNIRKRIFETVASLSLILLCLVACSCGAVSTTGKPAADATGGDRPAHTAPAAELPAWRTVDRNALCASLGWWDVTHGEVTAMKVALTFDAGGDAGSTATLLDELKASGVKATFFVTGQFAAANPLLVRRMSDEGHELGNHSDTHPRFTTISLEQARDQVAQCEQKVKAATGQSTKPYFRFPYGVRSNETIKLVNSMGYLSVSWTVDDGDWEAGRSASACHDTAVNKSGPGAILLMHCGSPQEAEVLPRTIADIRAKGLQVVTVTELLSDRGANSSAPQAPPSSRSAAPPRGSSSVPF